MNELTLLLLSSIGYGILGALLRVLVSTSKYLEVKKKVNTQGVLFFSIVALVSGAFAGIILNYGRIGSVLAGYGAIDLMEGFYTSFKKTKINIK